MSGASLMIPRDVRRAIVRHARQEQPLECCGLLLGRARQVICIIEMANMEASPVRYRIDDRAHIDLRRALRRSVPPLVIQGVYHSHPKGDARPSETDIREAQYPGWVHVIVGLARARAVVRGYRIAHGRAREIPLG